MQPSSNTAPNSEYTLRIPASHATDSANVAAKGRPIAAPRNRMTATGVAATAGGVSPRARNNARSAPREVDESLFDVHIDQREAHAIADVEAVLATHDATFRRRMREP